MDSIIEFFGAESTAEAIYWLMASISTGYLGLKSILGLIGLDMDHELDVSINGDDISLSAFAAFFSITGWVGVVGYQSNLEDLPVLFAASLAGITGFALSIWMMKKMKGLEQAGNLKLESAVGKVAEVYLKIPQKREGVGQVQLVVQDRLRIMDALTDGHEIISGSKVLIYATEDDKLLVEPYVNTLESNFN